MFKNIVDSMENVVVSVLSLFLEQPRHPREPPANSLNAYMLLLLHAVAVAVAGDHDLRRSRSHTLYK